MPSECHRGVKAMHLVLRENVQQFILAQFLLSQSLKNALTYDLSAKQYYLSGGCKLENKALKLPGQRHAE